jgi:hypothetical protein
MSVGFKTGMAHLRKEHQNDKNQRNPESINQ